MQNEVNPMCPMLIDCWGVLFNDAFKEFLKENREKLTAYLQNKGFSDTFPDYYFELARKIDLREIDDEKFYGILSEASSMEPREIKERFNDTSGLNLEVVKAIKCFKGQNHKVALAINAERKFLDKFLAVDNVGKLFDITIASEELGVSKPHSDFFKFAAQKLGESNLEKIILIDDSDSNIQAAKKLGINLCIRYNGQTAEKLINQVKQIEQTIVSDSKPSVALRQAFTSITERRSKTLSSSALENQHEMTENKDLLATNETVESLIANKSKILGENAEKQKPKGKV